MNLKSSLTILASAFLLTAYAPQVVADTGRTLSPVDYVNPYIGNISHLLVPTFPTIQLPNSLMRVYPERADYTGDRLNGLPIIVTNHRERSAFNFTPFQGDAKALRPVAPLSYDLEKITPYRYQVYLDEAQIHVDFAPSHQSAVYRLQFEQSEPTHLVFNSRKGALKVEGNTVQGFQYIDNKTKIYLYVELDKAPEKAGVLASSAVDYAKQSAEGENAAVVLSYAGGVGEIGVRYGISLIDEAQAKKNLAREIKDYSVATIAEAGRAIWNETLGKIAIEGGTYGILYFALSHLRTSCLPERRRTLLQCFRREGTQRRRSPLLYRRLVVGYLPGNAPAARPDREGEGRRYPQFLRPHGRADGNGLDADLPGDYRRYAPHE